MSLKQTIYRFLELNGYLSLRDLEFICKGEQKKLSNGERRLRELMASNPQIKPETNARGAIIAYRLSNNVTFTHVQPKLDKPLPSTVKFLSQFKKKEEATLF